MRAVELLSVCLFSVLVFINGANLSLSAWLLPLAALIGWLLADLLSGLAHWAGDSFGSERTPVLGPALIRPFREHHTDPRAMTRHDFIEVNGASCLGCLPILMVFLFFSVSPFIHSILVFLCLGILLANQCHKWAHTQRPPGFVRSLQKIGLILRAEEHRLHHRSPYNSHYCTASGWLNRPLNLLLK
jgi:hypothetical protein